MIRPMINTFKIPDKKAPRFRQSSIGLLNKDFFALFLEKYPEYKNVDHKVLSAIVREFNTLLWETVISHRDGIELPEGLGYVFLGSCATTPKENPDYNNSRKVGKRVMNRNLLSDGYLAKIFYTNHESKYKFRHRRLWKFKGGRTFTNSVSKAFKEDFNRYIVVEDFVKISSLYRRRANKRKVEYRINEVINSDYNEFDID